MDSHTQATVGLFAAKAMSKRLAKVCGQVQPVRDGRDPEAVHRMRVACRRLRAAMTNLHPALPGGKAKRWQRQVKRLGSALGQARDTDVQIQFIADYRSRLNNPGRATGIKRLHLRLSQQRQRLQHDVLAAVDRFEQSDAANRMHAALEQMSIKARRVNADLHDATLREYAGQAIEQRLDELLAYEPFVAQPHMVDALHRMRLVAKRLRYTMELFAPAFRKRLDSSIRAVRNVQTALGDLHDTDVWIELLPAFLEAEQQRTQAFFGHLRGFKRVREDILKLREDRIGHRELAYEQFTSLWRRLNDQGQWQTLRQQVHTAPPSVAPTDPVEVAPPPADAAESQQTPATGTQPDTAIQTGAEPSASRATIGRLTQN